MSRRQFLKDLAGAVITATAVFYKSKEEIKPVIENKKYDDPLKGYVGDRNFSYTRRTATMSTSYTYTFSA